MSNDELLSRLKDIRDGLCFVDVKDSEAFELALEALSDDPKADLLRRWINLVRYNGYLRFKAGAAVQLGELIVDTSKAIGETMPTMYFDSD